MWNVNNEEIKARAQSQASGGAAAGRSHAREPMSTRADVAASFRALLLDFICCHLLHGCHDGFESARVKEQLIEHARLVAVGGEQFNAA